MTAPRRRWFRFSLRTLFVVVTVFCDWTRGWFVYQLNWIWHRHAFLNESYTRSPEGWLEGSLLPDFDPPEKTPWTLRLFGEEPISYICIIPYKGPEYVARCKELFPEAEVESFEASTEPSRATAQHFHDPAAYPRRWPG